MTVKMAEEYGDDVAIVFAEAQGHSIQEVEKLALQSKWFGNSAMWTTERPVPSDAKGIPDCVLLDIEGRPILRGNPLAIHKELEEAIANELKKIKHGPDDLPKDLRDAWRDFARGKWSDAIAAADKVADSAGDDATLAEAAKKYADQWRAGATKTVESIGRMIDQGYYEKAEQKLKHLVDDLKGLDDVHQQAVALQEKLDSKDLESERKAENALRKMEDQLFKKGARNFKPKPFERLVDKYPNTKAAEQAKQYIEILSD